jgi:(E)-4-hydroxy-3-methylbut-2-enyl-diphosphate synthase
MIKRYPTKQIFVGNVPIGGDAPIPVQSMTFTKTSDVKATVEQITALHFAGADIVRVAVPNMEAALALKEIKSQVDLPLVADIHFHYKLALIAAEVVDCMVASADYNIKYLEDLGFTNMKISLKASDVQRTVEAYRTLRPMNNYPFHLGVTEAGTQFHSTIKSSIALGSLLLDGIGDTLRVSMTGELEEEIKVGKAILKDVGIAKEGLNIVSCPTCGRIEADLVSAVAEIEKRTKHIKTPLDVSVMGCVVNAIGEAKSADVAIAFGKGSGLVMKRGEIIAKLSGDALINRFIEEVEYEAEKRK